MNPSRPIEGAGNAGRRCARSRAWWVESTRVSHHGHTGNTRHSPRNGFTAYSALSSVTGLSCHRRHLRSLLLKSLMPASGHQDHTTSPSALAPRPRLERRRPRPPHPAPTSVTIAKRPSCGAGRQGYTADLGPLKSEISEFPEINCHLRGRARLHDAEARRVTRIWVPRKYSRGLQYLRLEWKRGRDASQGTSGLNRDQGFG